MQESGFNAARGFVGGAAPYDYQKDFSFVRFNAARGFVGGAASVLVKEFSYSWRFQCRTRLCGWCSWIRSRIERHC